MNLVNWINQNLGLTVGIVGFILFLLNDVRIRLNRRTTASKIQELIEQADQGKERSHIAAKGTHPKYLLRRIIDWFRRNYMSQVITIIRFNAARAADHRTFTVNPKEFHTVTWGDRTYNLRDPNIIETRGEKLLLAVEGCAETINPYLWAKFMNQLAKSVNEEKLEADLKVFGRTDYSDTVFNLKMHSHDAREIMDASSEINPKVLLIAIVGVGLVSLASFAVLMGWIPSGNQETLLQIKNGLIEVYKLVNK